MQKMCGVHVEFGDVGARDKLSEARLQRRSPFNVGVLQHGTVDLPRWQVSDAF
jgi:hypothetical protein